MERIMATSPLLAKVVRGAHLFTGESSGSAVAAGFFEDVPDDSKSPVDPAAVSRSDAVPNPRGIPERGFPVPEADFSDRTEESGSPPEVRAARFPGEEVKGERKPGGVRLNGIVPLASQFAAQKVPPVNVPASAGNESEAAGGQRAFRESGPAGGPGGSPAENRLQALKAGDFRPGYAKRREKGEALKALFPEQSPEPKNDSPVSVVSARAKGVGLSRREGEQDENRGLIDTGALPSRKSLDASPEELKGLREGPLRKEEHDERAGPKSPARQEEAAQGTMEIPPGLSFPKVEGFESSAVKAALRGAVVERPFLKSDLLASSNEASPQEMVLHREGRVKIGKINILVNTRARIENEEVWPEAPSYADHMITEDWEWSCLYGR